MSALKKMCALLLSSAVLLPQRVHADIAPGPVSRSVPVVAIVLVAAVVIAAILLIRKLLSK